MLPPSALSRLVASKALRTVPYPLLGENTLVLSDSCCLAPDDSGRLSLLFRCAQVHRSPGVLLASHTLVFWTILPTRNLHMGRPDISIWQQLLECQLFMHACTSLGRGGVHLGGVSCLPSQACMRCTGPCHGR